MDFELRATDRKSESTERQTLIYFTVSDFIYKKKKPDKERQ